MPIATLSTQVEFVPLLCEVVFRSLQSGEAPFAVLCERLRDLSKQAKGDLFEELCCCYLRQQGYEAWRLREVPAELRAQLALRAGDFGIDLVARDPQQRCHAVQAKFRQARTLSWRDLSTFDALTQRTGPWALHWVMTTAASVRRIGRRAPKDKSFCAGSWARLPTAFWLDAAQLHGRVLGSPSAPEPAPEPPNESQVEPPLESQAERTRRLRLARFG